jgi:hypothetical protein
MEYIDHNGKTVTVRPGLDNKCFIVVRVNPNSGSGHRIKSKLLPPRKTREECEADLKVYALGKKWTRVPDWPASDKCQTRPRCEGCPTEDGKELCSPEELEDGGAMSKKKRLVDYNKGDCNWQGTGASLVEQEIDRGVDLQMKQQSAQEANEKKLITQTYQMIGRIEAGNFFGKFISLTTLYFYKQAKELKLYRKLPEIGTWAEYCKRTGRSRRLIDESLQNLEQLGPQFYETASKFGVGYRDLRSLRKLPDGERKDIIEELEKREDIKKEEFLDLLEQSLEKKIKAETAAEEATNKLSKTTESYKTKLAGVRKERDEAKKLLGDKRDPGLCLKRLKKTAEHMEEAHKLLESIDFEALQDENNFKTRIEMVAITTKLDETVKFLVNRVYRDCSEDQSSGEMDYEIYS